MQNMNVRCKGTAIKWYSQLSRCPMANSPDDQQQKVWNILLKAPIPHHWVYLVGCTGK
jgi:hypothetical protein